MDVKVKDERVIAGAQCFRRVQVRSNTSCRKCVNTGY